MGSFIQQLDAMTADTIQSIETPAEPSTTEGSAPEPEVPVAAEPAPTDEPAVEAPATEDAAPAEAAPDAAPKEAAKPEAPTLPEEMVADGAQARTRAGKEEIVFDKARGMRVYDGYKLSKQLSDALGSPLTPEAIESIQVDKGIIDNIETDVISGPDRQARAFRFVMNTADEMFRAGRSAADPTATMAQAIAAAASSRPAVDSQLSTIYRGRELDRLYGEASKMGIDKGQPGHELFKALQYVERAATGEFRRSDKMKPATAADATAQELSALRAEKQAREQHAADQQWGGWQRGAVEGIKQTADAAIEEVLAVPLKELKTSKPERYKNLTLRLDHEIKAALSANQQWKAEVANIYERARLAGNEGVRDSYRQQLVTKAKALIARIVSEKAPSIISEETASLVGQSKAKQQRAVNGQAQPPLNGAGGKPAPATVPAPAAAGGLKSPQQIHAEMRAYLAS